MSFNQSRSDKSEIQNRKSGRSASFNQPRTSSGAYGKGGGGGGGPAPSPSSSSLSYNRSFKKPNNAQGGQSRVHTPPIIASDSGNASTPRNVQNGAHIQPPLHGASDVPVASGVAKPTEALVTQRSTRAVPKAPTSQSSAMSSEATVAQSASSSSDTSARMTPAKAPGDASKAFAFQFGSLSPGFMNGMQIPARTSSAPPNLDEQKRDQARHDTYRSVPPVPSPAPKQQLPRKDASSVDQSNIGEAYQVPKAKKDIQVSPAPPVSQTQKSSVHPIPMTSMQMPFHQTQVSMQFGGPNPQIQSQGVTAASIQMPIPMPLPMGNAPQMQQPMFVQGLQPHPLQHQGIMHQGQSLSFATQMGPPMPPQLGNLGIGITSQYSQQQGGKFGGPRKTPVKITDPKTHEELRLDKRTDGFTDGGSSGLRSQTNVPPQSQPTPSFAPSHPMNYYTNSYNAGNLFFPTPGSLPLTSSQIAPTSQPPRFNYPVSQGPQNLSFGNPSALNSLPVNKSGTAAHGVAESLNSEQTYDVYNAISSASSGAAQVTIKPAAGSIGEKVVDVPLSSSLSAPEKGGSLKSSRPSAEAGSSHLPRDSEACSDSPLQQPKPGSESSLSNLLPLATKQSVAVVVDSLVSSSLLPVDASTQSEESMPIVTNAEGGRRETLSRSNSIKDHQKKPVKKGHSQALHQIGGQANLVSSLPSHAVDHGLPSVSGISESVESKTTLSEGSKESAGESVSTVGALTSDVSLSKVDNTGDGFAGVLPEISGAGAVVNTPDAVHHAKLDDSSPQEQQKLGAPGTEEQKEKGLTEGAKKDDSRFQVSTETIASKPVDLVKQTAEKSTLMATAVGNEVPTLETAQEGLDEPVTCHAENDRMSNNMDVSTSRNLDSSDVGKSHSDNTSTPHASSGKGDDEVGSEGASVTKSTVSDEQSIPISNPNISEATLKHEGVENTVGGSVSLPASSSKDKPVELNKSKITASKVKKKRREMLQKADAAGTTSDLYMAYKGPEEKKENVGSSDVNESTSPSPNSKQAPADALQVDCVASEKGAQNKAEPENWEDAADISTPKLEASDNGELSLGGLVQHDGSANTGKKYSRDFLLKFSEQCTDLPGGFEIPSDIADALISVTVSHVVDRDSYPSPGRVIDRSNSGSRIDRRGIGMADDDRWSKLPGPFGSSRDSRVDLSFGVNPGFRPAQGGYSVQRNPRAQSPVQYMGGILPGPMPAIISQGAMQRNGPDAERWQRATNIQHRGLIPSPQTPLQVMHKADKKYEVGNVTDEEQAKQRQLKAILNKLTPQNFEKLFEQVKAVNIDNAGTLTGVISQIFDKALMEPTFCEMYANFCLHLAGELPDFSENNEKITFKRLLLNKCQEEFERGEREQEEAKKADEEGAVKQSEEEREEKRLKARRRMLGNIRLIGELFKKKMLTERIMHECIRKLLGQCQNPDEEDVEALCKLMSTIGEMIDHSKAKVHMDAYFERMAKLSNDMKLSSRVRFMLKDAIDLRKNNWQQRRKVEGPKKIEEVHRDAAQERQHISSRPARNPSMNLSSRRVSMDFGPKGSTMLSSPNAFRGLPTQVRVYGTQDVRFEERQSYEARTLSVSLPQRPLGDDCITLGPQGGLARGMSIRGLPAIASAPVADIAPSPGDSRRMTAGLNGFSTMSERPTYTPREDLIPRYGSDRFAGPAAYDQLGAQARGVNYVNRDLWNLDHGFDRPHASSPPIQAQGPGFTQSIPSEKLWPEERLRDMSMAAIKEFYSARDEEEVALCIRDLNSPSFHPSMISLWVTDSFERKDIERDLLAKLLVNLTRSRDSLLTPAHLIKGFESVLTTLEDAVNDAPKAAEFLGRIFAKVVSENVVPLKEIGWLLHEGGEEPGRLLEVGLAGDVLGSTLGIIKAEKGESILNEIRNASNLHLEDFQPPDPNRSRILEQFI